MRRKSATLGTHERIFMAFYIDEMHHNLSIYSRVPEVAESNENLHEDKKLLHRARLSFDKYLLKQKNTSIKLRRET
jgi:ubiquitin C-terminal hydrolase